MGNFVLKLAMVPVLLVAASALAACYGALHNQISYSVAPVYFHEFKFIQFGIPADLHGRWGAAVVGALASWWMGILIGVPIALVTIWTKKLGSFVRIFSKAALIVVLVTLLVGLGVLGMALINLDAATLPDAMRREGISDPVGFARAGAMHDASYLGGFVGLVCGVIYAVLAVRKTLKSHRQRGR